MKESKRPLTLLGVVVMAMSLMVPALATESPETVETPDPKTVTITITDEDTTRTYEGYRLLKLTTSGDGDTDAQLNYAYTVNEKYHDIMAIALGLAKKDDAEAVIKAVTDDAILAEIGKLDDKTTPVNTFADTVYRAIKAKGLSSDATIEKNTATVAEGYWLIVETTNDLGEGEETMSRVILDTAGKLSVEVKPKRDKISLEKEADKKSADIGEDLVFTLTSNIPDLTNYELTTYTYYFLDTLSSGLTLKADTIKVNIEGITADLILGTDYKVYEGKSYTPKLDDNQFMVSIILMKAEYSGKKIVVTYDATVNENAEVGVEHNKVQVTYSNTPHDEGTGKTVIKEVPVYNFKIDVIKYADGDTDGHKDNKYDPDSSDMLLDGAEFVLYKEVEVKGVDGNPTNEGDGNKVVVKAYYKYDADTKKIEWVAEADADTQATTDGTFSVVGLAEGTYYLVETKAPAGYNLLKYEVKIELNEVNTTDENGEITYALTTYIQTETGPELPSTGGIGTTMFYVLGGLLTLSAAVLLITKRRLSSFEE